jgi:hypothetical protein
MEPVAYRILLCFEIEEYSISDWRTFRTSFILNFM